MPLSRSSDNLKPNRPGWNVRPWKLATIAGCLAIIGSAFWFSTEQAARVPMPVEEPSSIDSVALPIDVVKSSEQVSKFELGNEKGQAVFRIQVVENGDEVIVDATSGKVLGVRDSTGRLTWLKRPEAPNMDRPKPMT